MKHPDEGTVHAWLDGALDDADARELEAHVATCVPCAAMVAEARGLIAAASRIVTQLDGVPSAVLPQAPLVPARAPAEPHRGRSAFTSRRAAAWRWPGLAAAALLCVTTASWYLVRQRAPAPIPAMAVMAATARPLAEPATAADVAVPPAAAKANTNTNASTNTNTNANTNANANATRLTAVVPRGGNSGSLAVEKQTEQLSVTVAPAAPVRALASARGGPPPLTSVAAAPTMAGCYELLPGPTANVALDVRPPAAARALAAAPPAMATAAMATAAMATRSMPTTLRLTDSLAAHSEAATAERLLYRAASVESSVAFVGHLAGRSADQQVRWTVSGAGVARVILADGRAILIRVGPDSTGRPGLTGQPDFIAKRTTCP